jgi:hypothetical protein
MICDRTKKMDYNVLFLFQGNRTHDVHPHVAYLAIYPASWYHWILGRCHYVSFNVQL